MENDSGKLKNHSEFLWLKLGLLLALIPTLVNIYFYFWDNHWFKLALFPKSESGSYAFLFFIAAINSPLKLFNPNGFSGQFFILRILLTAGQYFLIGAIFGWLFLKIQSRKKQ